MSKGIKVFTLTNAIRARTLGKVNKRLAEGTKPLYPDHGKVMRCQHCKEPLRLGKKVVSKLFGHSKRVQYHVKCARFVHII